MTTKLLNDEVYLLPSFLPPGWRKIVDSLDGAKYRGPKGLSVIITAAVEQYKNSWLHVSVAHRDRLPSYDELKQVKAIFMGRDKYAIQVFPPDSKHINIHPYCLHLWSCLSSNLIPDFTRGGNSI